jgi:hypothetical protein
MTRDRSRAWRWGAVVFGAGWSASLIGLGLAGRSWGAPPWVWVSCVAWGQFVGMTLVADRLCPPRRPGLAWRLELAAAGAGLAALASAPLGGA